ncbi:hypothetical protein GCM10011379_32590 [Filimonas zeae]|uniref:Uncharacterized protein n=2 Tax=Filimonas zeae TaxID=1737353 RepID=A0A917MX26_9BACT|nr:hypothetical protein GCM10011379_32590 [Filimonas zeae]
MTLLAKADQLATLTPEQAEKAVTYLKKESVVVLWCSCCKDDPLRRVTVKEVFRKALQDGKHYSVVLKGRDENGKEIEEYLDLAYVFVKKKSEGHSLGKLLKFKCDPCVPPFYWDAPAAG